MSNSKILQKESSLSHFLAFLLEKQFLAHPPFKPCTFANGVGLQQRWGTKKAKQANIDCVIFLEDLICFKRVKPEKSTILHRKFTTNS